MGNKEQAVLLVSNDAGFCAAMRREFDASAPWVRAASVSSVAAARRILEEDCPGVILLEEDTVANGSGDTKESVQSLEAVVAPLAVHAPVVVIGPAEKRRELAGLIEAGVADFFGGEKKGVSESRGGHLQRAREARPRGPGAPG